MDIIIGIILFIKLYYRLINTFNIGNKKTKLRIQLMINFIFIKLFFFIRKIYCFSMKLKIYYKKNKIVD